MNRCAWLTWTILVACAVRADATPVSSPRAGALVFFASQVRATLPLPIAELRDDVQTRVDAALEAAGLAVVPSQDIVARAGTARVRSAAALPASFLNELRTEAGLDQLTLVEVIIATDRVILLARVVDAASGQVADVWLSEAPVGPAVDDAIPGAWRAALDTACRALSVPSAGPATGGPVLILPTAPVGSTAEEGLLATYAVLHQVRVVCGRSVFDPAVVRATLMAAGHDPEILDADARALLTTRFGTPHVVRSLLVPTDAAGTTSPRAMDDAGPPLPLPLLHGYSFTISAVDLQDGHIAAAAAVHHEPPATMGLFGRPRRVTPLADLLASTASAWTSLQSRRGDL